MADERGKLALVTGAGGGIGRATAIILARQGFAVMASDISAANVESVVTEISDSGGKAIRAAGDITRDDMLDRIFAHAASEGGLDALVHSAGLFPRKAFIDSSVADLDRVMNINFRAAFTLTQRAVPQMQAKAAGSIVHLTSGAGLLENAGDSLQQGFSFYGASKAALDRWALGIASELKPLGVAINTITPAKFVMTPGVQAAGLPEAAQATADEIISPEDVGEAVAWLAQVSADQMTGKRLRATEFGKSWGSLAAA